MRFNEKVHKYKKDGKHYISVSQVIDQYKKPFEREKIAKAIADRDNRDKDKILLEWQLKGDVGRCYGDAIHKSIELWIKFGEKPKLKYLSDVVDKFAEKYDRKDLFSEIVVFDKDKGIAGRTDVLKRVKGGVELIDIKTNNEISDKAKDNFLPPINLPQSTLNEYRLQQSFYKKMIELHGIKVKKIKLEHLADKFKTINIEPIDMDNLWDKIKIK